MSKRNQPDQRTDTNGRPLNTIVYNFRDNGRHTNKTETLNELKLKTYYTSKEQRLLTLNRRKNAAALIMCCDIPTLHLYI